MEREQQQAMADAEATPVVEGDQPAPVQASSGKGGAVPGVVAEHTPGTAQTASEQAYDPATAGKEKQAERDTKKVLEHIRTQAKARAKSGGAIAKDSMLQKRLQEFYLKDYLANPNKDTGKQAVEKVGAQIDPATADQSDYWEAGASGWNSHPVPPGLKLLIPGAPDEMGAGTDALSKKNRAELPYLDAPQMIGKPNTDTGADADVYGGGKNISQLMHWATGVKHSAADPDTMRDLFLAYEYYHLEGFDKFGEDSINDMISEDAGRIMGRQLQAGEINSGNLNGKLNEGFDEAAAWVGSLIKARQGELDGVITSKTVVESQMWWGHMPEKVQWWGDSTIYLDLLGGKSVEEVQADARTEHFIGIYSLIYHSEQWQKENQKIKHSNFTESMLDHKYDKVFEKSVKNQELTKREKVDAYLDAKAPWVPGFMRPLVQKLAGKKLDGGGDDGKH
jgi:hypothetical protein